MRPKTPRLLKTVGSWFAFGRNMHLIVASAFAANVVGTAGYQYMPMYIRKLGGSISDLGFFFSIQTVVMAVLALIGGWLVDRYNRRVLFSLTPAIGGIASLLMAIAPSWQWLVPGMCLSLLSMSIGGPIFFSMTSDIAPPARRAAYFGYQAMAFSICGIVGPLVGGFFFQYLDYRWFLALGAVLGLGASYLRTLLRDPREDPNWSPEGQPAEAPEAGPDFGATAGQSAGTTASDRRGLLGDFVANFRTFRTWAAGTKGIILFMFVVSLPAIASKLLESYGSVYVNEIGRVTPAAIGMLAAISGFAAIPANLFGGRLADRIGRRIAVTAAQTLSGLWILALTMVSGFSGFATLYVFDGLVHGGLFPSIDAWKADLCPSRHRGTFNGVLQLLGVLLAVPAPAVGAWLWAGVGPTAPIRLGAGIALLTGLLLYRFGPAMSRRKTPAVAAAPAPAAASDSPDSPG